MKKTLNKIAFSLVIFLVVVMPFQAFLLTWFKFLGIKGFSYTAISLWKEIILLVLILISAFLFFTRKDSVKIKIHSADKMIFLFFGLSFLYFIFFDISLVQKITGLRYDIEFFIFYLVLRVLSLNLKQFKILIFSFLASAFLAIIFGLMQISYLSPSFLQKFGYSANLGQYIETGILPTYEAVNPSLPDVYRIQSTFPGALQFGSFLTLIIFLSLSLFLYLRDKKKYLFIILAGLSFWALYGTHTRSAWLAVLTGTVFGLFFLIKNKKFFWGGLILAVSVSVFLGSLFFSNPKFQTILLHGEVRQGELFGSTQAHWEALLDSSEKISSNYWGHGVGYAGPASKNSTDPVISENWYLQIALEMGILGLALFVVTILAFISDLIIKLKTFKNSFEKNITLGLLCSLAGISFSSLMLHTFADTATVYPLFIFLGILFSLNSKPIN